MQELNATKHYLHYPKGEFPPYLAYGFRFIFLLLAPYMVLNIILWALFWGGVLPLSFLDDPITWHVYELVYGVGIGGVMAFLLTALPELFPGVVPLVGKKLAILGVVWLVGRACFWLVDYINVYIVMLINILPLAFIIFYAFKPVVLDPAQKHASLAYVVTILSILQIIFFLCVGGVFDIVPMKILYLSLYAFMALILLALRRINTEAVNEWLEVKGIDDVLFVRPPRYNLAIFCIGIYAVCEFFYPQNSVLGYLAFAASAAILGTLSEYKMDDSFILFEPYVLYLGCINIMMALGFGFMGYTFFDPTFGDINSFRHILTIGAFSISFFMVLVIVSYIHTGRHLESRWFITLGIISLIVSMLLRVGASFYPNMAMNLYVISSLLWMGAFCLYFFHFYKFLLNPRADGIKG